MRINQFIAHAGLCSRRKAEEKIAKGGIEVNGIPVVHPGQKIKESDRVTYQGKPLVIEQKVYLLFHKPFNTITTLYDPQKRRRVVDYLKDKKLPRLYPVGRLDRNTTGLLFLTNDGGWAQALAHPRNGIEKIYHLTLLRPFLREDLEKIREGIPLDDGLTKVNRILYLTGNPRKIALSLHSGKNRIIRRIFAHLGYRIASLKRVAYGGIPLGDLLPGHFRPLTPMERKKVMKKSIKSQK